MDTCSGRSTNANGDDEFVGSCKIFSLAKPDRPFAEEGHVRERDVCFGERERPRDYSGLVSFGIFLLIVGLIFATNPSIVSDFRYWVEQMTDAKTLQRPPTGLIASAGLFFALVGLSDFFIAGLRFMTDRSRRRVLSDVLSGIALLAFSYLIYLYLDRTIQKGLMVIAMELVVIGILVIVYSAMRFLSWKKPQ